MAEQPLFGMPADGSYMNSFMPRDPAYMPVARKLSLAQAMMARGLDSSAAYPMQALARVVQGGLGAFLENRGEGEFKDVQSTQDARDQSALGSLGIPGLGSPLANAMMPPQQQTTPFQSGALPSSVSQPPPAVTPTPPEAKPFVAKNVPSWVTPDEDATIRTVYGEAAGEPPEGQRAVAAVIANRAKQSGQSPLNVVTAKGQFEPWGNPATRAKLEALDPNSEEYQKIFTNIQPILAGTGTDPTGGATHFYSPTAQEALGREPPAWAQGQEPLSIGRHQFYKLGYTAPGGSGGVAARTGGTDVAMDTGGGSATDASNPLLAAIPGGVRAPGGGMVPGSATGQTTQAGGGVAQQAPAGPQTGMNAPNVKAGFDMMQRGITALAHLNPYSRTYDRDKAVIQGFIQQGQVMMGLDTTYIDPRTGIQTNQRTGGQASAAQPLPHYAESTPGVYTTPGGTDKPVFAPTPRTFTDQYGNVGGVMGGGQTVPLAANPTGVTGNTPESNAMRLMAALKPLIDAGTATPQQKATYDAIAPIYEHRDIVRNPAGQLESVPRNPIPSAPETGSSPASGASPPGQPQTSPGGVTTMTPGSAPTEAINERYKKFQDLEKTQIGARDELQQARLLKQTLHELGSTGPATPFLANLSRYAEQAGVPQETIRKFNLPPGATETQAAALANALVMEIARAGFPQRITNNDLQFASSVKPNPAMPLAASDFLIDNTIVPRAQRDIERYGSIVHLTDTKHPEFDPSMGSMNKKLFDFDQAHPLSSYTPRLSAGGAYKEGQTATGPNGKIVFKNGAWVPM